MKILAFMQNQWFREPARIERLNQRFPDMRRSMIKRFLFMGCKSGQVLKQYLGEDICDAIVWEEISKKVGGHSSAAFPADREHILQVLAEEKPRIVLTFGGLAKKALEGVRPDAMHAPHPAARHDIQREMEDFVLALATLATSCFESELKNAQSYHKDWQPKVGQKVKLGWLHVIAEVKPVLKDPSFLQCYAEDCFKRRQMFLVPNNPAWKVELKSEPKDETDAVAGAILAAGFKLEHPEQYEPNRLESYRGGAGGIIA